MKKYLLSTLLSLFCFLLAVAAPVDEQSAREIATKFLQANKSGFTRAAAHADLKRAFTGVADGKDAGIYVFNTDNGFVVVSANDQLPAVLAYDSDKSYNAETAPDAMKALLQAYHQAATSAVTTRAAVATHSDISPMITTHWDQNAPYNMYCPKDNGQECPTGCVATAMAQIMYYHKWPETFDWNAMKTTYDESDNSDAAKAVANLMSDVGKKVFMNYTAGSSEANEYDACEALRNNYNYAESTELIKRSCYTASSWDEVMYKEIAAKRPVLYAAYSVSSGKGIGGHAFVIDGYQAKDGTGYYHVNWGWGGYSDSYFLISVLNPKAEYTGGNAGSSGYSVGQTALIGIEKGKVGVETSYRLSLESLSITSDKGAYTRLSTLANFPAMQLEMSCYNSAGAREARHYDLAYAIYQDDKLVQMIDSISLKDYVPNGAPMDYLLGFSSFTTSPFSFGKGLANGTYQLRVLSRETGKKNWQLAMCGVCRYIELTIDGTNMTTTAHGRYDDSTVYSFKINSVTVSENCEYGKPMTITVNVTDKNRVGNSPIYLYGNASLEQGSDKFQLLGGCGTNLDAGQTGDVVLEYTPQRAGKFVFYLSGNQAELTDSLYRFEVVVSGLSINLDVDVDGAKMTDSGMSEVAGSSLKGTIHLFNYGSEAYNNDIFVDFFGGSTINDMKYIGSKKETVNIGVGETKDLPFSYDGLTTGNYYMILVSAKDGNDIKPLNYEEVGDGYISFSYDVIYLLTGDTAIQSLELDTDDADVYDMRGVQLGKASDLKNLPKGIYIINKKKVIK